MRQPSVLGIVSYKVFPAQMGGQKCVVDFYRHLANVTKVVLAVHKDNPPSTDDWQQPSYPIMHHHKKGPANLLNLFRLRKIIQTQQIDLICIEHSYLGWLGILLRWLTHKPFVIRSHNIEAHRFRDMQKAWWPIYQWYEKQVHRRADLNFFITEEDRQWAMHHWQLSENKCTVISYGTTISGTIPEAVRLAARIRLLKENNLPADTRLFLFSGTLDYLPNTDALRIIISELLPLLQATQIPFRVFICGRFTTTAWKKVLSNTPGIIFKDFVPDINLYLHGSDCFMNPVTLGSGIKIKLVDALAHDLAAVSTRSGARGVDSSITGNTLRLVNDYDWPAFVQALFEQADHTLHPLPESFYHFFNWDHIVQKGLLSLRKL